MLKKYPLECLSAMAAIFGIFAWWLSIVLPTIEMWWLAHWVLCMGVGTIVLSGATCHKWVPVVWKAYVATTDRADIRRMREQHYLMLAGVTAKLEQGFDTQYKNAVHGFEISVHNPYMKNQVKIAEVPSQELLAPVVPHAPDYSQVDGLITDQQLVLCYTASGPVFGTVVDLLSMCVVGKPGRGKSTALLYYILILLKVGAEVWVWDPHSGLNDLAYGLNYCDDLGDIEESCAVLHRQLEQRRKLWKEQKRVMHPLLLLVDEMPVISDYENDRLKELKGKKEDLLAFDQFYRPSRLLKKFVLEARKWNCYVILSGQALPAEVLSTLTRDNMSSRIVFESCNMHAKMAGLQKEEIDSLLPALKGAGPGVAVMDVSRWSKPMLAAIPNTTVDDLRAFIDGGRISESDHDTGELSAVPNFENWLDLSMNDESTALPENGANELGEKLDADADEMPVFGTDDYMLSSLQMRLFTAYYQDCGNIAESLSRIKNEKGQGLGRRYFRHASWIVKQKNLRRFK
jgi:hypothetical protein